jgi:hypothetical protein
MSNFKNPEILLKKHYIIHSSASACAISAGLPLWFGLHGRAIRDRDHYAVVCKVASRIVKDGRKVGEVILLNSWVWIFGGCFENLWI